MVVLRVNVLLYGSLSECANSQWLHHAAFLQPAKLIAVMSDRYWAPVSPVNKIAAARLDFLTRRRVVMVILL